jgi:hypothetical protein
MRRLLALTLVLASSTGFAQSEFQTGPYVGVGLGKVHYESRVFSVLTFEDDSIGPRVYGGFRFSETFAFEGFYSQAKDMTWVRSGNAPLVGPYTANLSGDFDIVELRVLAYAGRVLFGIGYFDSNFTVRGNVTTGLGTSPGARSDDDNGLTYLFGGEWPLNDWAIRAEFEYIDTEARVDAWQFGAGAHFKFR